MGVKVNGIRHVLRRYLFLHDAIKGQMTEMKRVGEKTQFIDDLRNVIKYWELMEVVEDRKRWKRQFIT